MAGGRFWWSLADGFRDLGDIVAGGLSVAGWQQLSNVKWQADNLASAGPQYIVGGGYVNGQIRDPVIDQSAYLMTAIGGGGPTADFNSDTKVNSVDLGIWRTGFGKTTGALHGDGDADGADLLAWKQQYGIGGLAIAADASVPEPTAISLAAFGAAWAYGRGLRLKAPRERGNRTLARAG